MTQIYSIYGKIHSNHSQYECICQIENQTYTIRIPTSQRKNCLPGDEVYIILNPLNQWILNNGESLENSSFVQIRDYFNLQYYKMVMNNFKEVKNTLELLELINQILPSINMIIPTGEVYSIEKRNIQQQINNEKYKEMKTKLESTEPVDHTDLFTITIDDSQCAMRDDAISFRTIDNQYVEIGIHCANYVTKIDPKSNEMNKLRKQEILDTFHGNKYGLELGRCETFSLFIVFDIHTKQIVELRTGPSILDIKATFSFDSFTNTVRTRQLYESRINTSIEINELISSCIYMVEWMKYLEIYTENETNIGNSLINQIGQWVSGIAGRSLKDKYGELALISGNEGNEKATFRSPLRKRRDRFVIRQLVASSVNMTNEEMMLYVNCCLNEEIFQQFNQSLKKRKNNKCKRVNQ